MGKKTKCLRLSVYLIKNRDLRDDDIVKRENANPVIPIDLGAGSANLYVKTERPRPFPDWTELFTSLPDFPDGVFGRSNSVGAVLICRGDVATFLLSFGSGHHLVQEAAVERDFGLRVALNSVHNEELRSLDKASYDAHNPLNSRTQSSKGVDIFDLDVDDESEMLYAVTGLSADPKPGVRVTGRDALSFQIETRAEDLPELLEHIHARYQAPLPPEFEWVENVSQVRDPESLELLDLVLDDYLKRGDRNAIWLGDPEIVDWEGTVGYTFDMRPRTGMQFVLNLDQLEMHLMSKGESLSVASLRKQGINLVDANFQPIKQWTAYRCLHAEISENHETYVLRNGNWHRVKADFVGRIDAFMKTVETRDLKLPQYNHAGEGDYNLQVAANDPRFECMDKRNVGLGGAYDKIEFCDLICDRATLVHVKYYRSSSTLSHLFSQGLVAAEAFVKEEGFRVKLNEKLPKSCRLADPLARPDAARYTVIYAIATSKTLPLELPFFSKVTLKNAVRTLRAMNYDVGLTHIPLHPELTKRSSHRANGSQAK